jgi:hypothetical protein
VSSNNNGAKDGSARSAVASSGPRGPESLYARQLGQQFHAAAILEMCRVASECRVFPLLELDGTRSPLVEPVGNTVREYGFDVSIEQVPYEFQRRQRNNADSATNEMTRPPQKTLCPILCPPFNNSLGVSTVTWEEAGGSVG